MEMGSKWDVEKVEKWLSELGVEAGVDGEFLGKLAKAMREWTELAEEFVYYMENGDFLCKVKVEGYSIIDILVWQMDHFKAQLDRDRYEMKHNRGKMVLGAFDTMVRMKKEPGKYKALMQSETGTDYPGKF